MNMKVYYIQVKCSSYIVITFPCYPLHTQQYNNSNWYIYMYI